MKTTSKLIIFVFALLALSASAYAADDSPLFAAVKKGDKAVVEELLAKGADVNVRKTSAPGRTLLIEAVVEGRKDIAELLLAKGADVNAKSTDGRAPLHWLAYGGRGTKDMAELLLAKGADVNAKDTADGLRCIGWRISERKTWLSCCCPMARMLTPRISKGVPRLIGQRFMKGETLSS